METQTNASKKRVALVGHCVPDSSHLTITVTRAVPGAQVFRATDDASTQKLIDAGVDLLLVNRKMEYGYADEIGTDYIRRLKAQRPDLKMMLITNFPDAIAEAVKLGAIGGFGKAELSSEKTTTLLRQALAD